MHNFKLITKPSFFNPSKSIFPSSINQQHSPCKSCFNILNEKTEKPCCNCVKIDQYQHKYPIPLIKMGGIEDTEFGVLPILPTVRTYIAGRPRGRTPIKKKWIEDLLARGWKPKEIAKEVNCTLPYVYNVKNGHKH